MTMETTKDIFKRYLGEYLSAVKARKGEILAMVVSVTMLHRKAAIRKFRNLQLKDGCIPEKRGRSEYYTPDVTAALKDIWEAGDEVCGELLHPMIREYVDILIRDKMWKHGDEVTDKLIMMSEATVKRRVGKFLKAKRKHKGISATRPSHLKQLIPTFSGPWDDKPPGYGQVDTVLHNDTALGDAVYTVNYTDAATLLVMPMAQWNKGQEATRESLKVIKDKLPFLLLGLHPDSGSEFINRFVYEWSIEEKIEYTRSRSGKKNDNMHVEERNGHVIRRHIGYIPLTCVEAVEKLNNVYELLTPYLIHFVAVRRLLSRVKVGARYVRKYEKKAKSPYQRIMGHPSVSEEVRTRLRTEHETLNPRIMKTEIEKRINHLYDVQKRYGKPRG